MMSFEMGKINQKTSFPRIFFVVFLHLKFCLRIETIRESNWSQSDNLYNVLLEVFSANMKA